jgi:hypothetical protein
MISSTANFIFTIITTAYKIFDEICVQLRSQLWVLSCRRIELTAATAEEGRGEKRGERIYIESDE